MGSAPKIPPPPPPPAPPPPPTKVAEEVKPARKQTIGQKRTRGVTSLTVRRPSVNLGGGQSGVNVNP
jgi:hypothetical protein